MYFSKSWGLVPPSRDFSDSQAPSAAPRRLTTWQLGSERWLGQMDAAKALGRRTLVSDPLPVRVREKMATCARVKTMG
jgi:hypothetical protein